MKNDKQKESTHTELKRSMPVSQIAVIGIGGTLGTGLFLSSGYTISNAGPGGTLFSYAFGALIMYLMMAALGELIVAIPDAGGVQTFSNRLINRTVGFTVGWIRWLSLVLMVPTQLVASSIIMKNIFPSIAGILWIVLFSILLFFLNFREAADFGRFNTIFSSIKFIFVGLFVIVGIGMLLGIGQAAPIGFANFTAHGGLFPNGGQAVLRTMMISAFAFGGADQIATAASESQNPSVDMPRALRVTIIGLLVAYFISLIIILSILPWNQANLTGSPFAYIFREAGFESAELIVNLVILTSALSSANAFVYGSIRSLWALGKEEQAPQFVTKVDEKGLPVNSLLVVFSVTLFAVTAAFISPDIVYLFLQSIIGISNMTVYAMYAVVLIYFRNHLKAENISTDTLGYKVKGYPVMPYLLLALIAFVIMGMIFDPTQHIALYTGIPTYIGIYMIGKTIEKKTVLTKVKLNG